MVAWWWIVITAIVVACCTVVLFGILAAGSDADDAMDLVLAYRKGYENGRLDERNNAPPSPRRP